jgi:caffeoyl-CoA O-methyltransferase
MNQIVCPDIERYLALLNGNGIHGRHLAVIDEMERFARKIGFPIVGPQVGILLYILARLSRANSVLELGSGFGYSALWFALALGDGGKVLCTDYSPFYKGLALDFFRKAGLECRLTFRTGDARQIVRTVDQGFDVVFCDIDKQDYPDVPDMVLPLLRENGLFITDNVLWQGEVVQGAEGGSIAAAVDRFNRKIMEHPELKTVILPLRDGVSVSLKSS